MADDTKDGFVVPNFPSGSLFVQNAKKEVIRLAWEPQIGEEQAPAKPGHRLRALTPGRYTVVGYRLFRKDDAGTLWHLSAINVKGLSHFQVNHGRTTRVAIGPAVITTVKANPGKAFLVQGSLQGPSHAGLSIYKKGKRIPMGFTITSADGKELEKGAMKYG